MSLETPKAGGAAFKELRARLMQVFDNRSLQLVAFGALERERAEKLVSRALKGRHPPLAKLSREQLVAQVALLFFHNDAAAYDVMRQLDRAASRERSLVASTPAAEVATQLGSHRALRVRRHGAKLLWALARDERDDVWPLAQKVVGEYVEHVERLERARAALREKGAGAELDELEGLYRETAERVMHLEAQMSAVEKQRAALAAEVGQRERALRRQSERTQQLAAELRDAQKAKLQAQPVVSPPVAGSARVEAAGGLEATDPARRVRKLEKRIAALEHERDALVLKAERAAELEEDNARLRSTIERLRELRARQRQLVQQRALDDKPRTKTVPVVESPKRRRGGHSKEARVGVFVDVANIAGAARRLFGRGVDYRLLLAQLAAGRRLLEARAYAIDKPAEGGGFDAFARALRQVGFKVQGKRPKAFADGTVKADWDVGITVDVMRLYSKLDVVILATGDGDFVPLVRALTGLGLRVEAASFAERSAEELRAAVDHFYDLDRSVLE